MTKEQYERLEKFEAELRYAVRMNFMSMTNGKFAELVMIYKDVYGQELNHRQMGCSTCRLNALKRLGKDYFAYQQELAEKEKAERLNAEEPKSEEPKVEEPKKKKAGRPRKIDLDAEQ